MSRIPLSPPSITPITDDLPRPQWSVMIPVYNCAAYLAETLQSVLEQDLGTDKMQIEVVDDCSTDIDVCEFVSKFGRGRVSYFRQEKNVGSLRNFETCINRARGHFIHLLHGDDRIKPGYYHEMSMLFESYPGAGAAFCACNYIKDDGSYLDHSRWVANTAGLLENFLQELARRQRLQYVTVSVKREVYEQLGAFYGVTYGEDWEMWVRIAKHYPFAYSPKTLAEYREHSKNSISRNSFKDGQNIRDIVQTINTIATYLPVNDQRMANKEARAAFMHWSMSMTYRFWWETHDEKIVYAQLREILKSYRDITLIRKSARLLLAVWRYQLLKKISPDHSSFSAHLL